MGLNVLKSLVTILIFSTAAPQFNSRPEERCVSNGSRVCLDCFRVATCVDNGDGTFSLSNIESCITNPRTYCDDTLFSSDGYGQCSPLPPSLTNCSCSTSSNCVADPNNPGTVLHCESDPPVSDPPCSAPVIDLTTCQCLSCSSTCPLVDDPNDDCASYFFCSGTNLIQGNCAENFCFNQESCKCIEIGESTSLATATATATAIIVTSTPAPTTEATIITEATTALTCTADCPFVDNPNDPCSSYFVCTVNGLTPLNCVDTLCFDQVSCGCVPAPAPPPTTEATTIPPTCPPGCPLLDDPSDNCTSYFVCTGAGWTTASCRDNLCFDQELCGCVPAPTTEITTMPTTCPPGCPFLDDPNDNCKRYFVCTANGLTPINCSDNLCFDQESCGCVPAPATTTTTTTTTRTTMIPSTCPPGCPFLDDPNDICQSYFVCTGAGLEPVNCSDYLCFDQESCGCVPAPTTDMTTIPSTCPPSCPFLDDPNDNCKSYFVCTGTGLTPAYCSDSLCFDQEFCGCVPAPANDTTTIPWTCPPDCPFLDDPNDNCLSYFLCSGPELIPLTCADDLCFDQTSCACIQVVESLPEPSEIETKHLPIPSVQDICPPDCPFIDDPNDDCGKYYYCDDDYLIQYQCPGSFCFDQSACVCQ